MASSAPDTAAIVALPSAPESGNFVNVGRSKHYTTPRGMKANYAERLQLVFDGIRDMIIEMADDLDYSYEAIEKDVFAQHTAFKRGRRVTGYNIFCSRKLAEVNESKFSKHDRCLPLLMIF
jgi:hypothetical protein